MDRADPGGVRIARPLLPRTLPRGAAQGARPDRPERPGHSNGPTSQPEDRPDIPGERIHDTAHGQVTTGTPAVSRRPQPVTPAPGATPKGAGP